MDERVRKCERALGLGRKRIGFDTSSVVGDRIEQDEDDPEIEEMP